MSGSLATILAWTNQTRGASRLEACKAASHVVRNATRAAYVRQKRALVAPDIIEELGPAFDELCPPSSAP